MHLDRIQWLIEAIKSAPTDDFNMQYWECGTSHCAGGWLCLDPRAQQLGLHLDNPNRIFCDVYPCYQDFVGLRALAVFLDISIPSSYYIFDPYHYYKNKPIKKTTVLCHINQVIAKRST